MWPMELVDLSHVAWRKDAKPQAAAAAGSHLQLAQAVAAEGTMLGPKFHR